MNFFINRGGYGQYRCPKKMRGRRPRVGEEVSAAKGTWFEGHHLPITASLQLMFCWTEDLSYEDSRRHCLQHLGKISDATVAD